MVARILLLVTSLLVLPCSAQEVTPKPLPRKAALDPLSGPPFVTAKSWVIADGKTGKALWGENLDEARAIASTTKIMTALLVLELASDNPKVLDEIVTYSARAAATRGSSARLREGDKLAVRELLYGLLLPSGNDASVAFAEHFGPRFAAKSKQQVDGLAGFVAEMNRRAKALHLTKTSYLDPHGLGKNLSCAADLARLGSVALRNKYFPEYVRTRRHVGTVVGKDGNERKVTWNNTNRLLGIDGYEGIKTGTTNAAGSCLVSSGRRGTDHLIVVILGSTSNDSRYADTRNLFRYGWLKRGHQP